LRRSAKEYVYKPRIQEVRSAVKVPCSSQGGSCANTESIMRYCMVKHFFALVNDDTLVVMTK